MAKNTINNWVQALVWIVIIAFIFWLLSGCAPTKEHIKERPYFTPATKLDSMKYRLYLKEKKELIQEIQKPK